MEPIGVFTHSENSDGHSEGDLRFLVDLHTPVSRRAITTEIPARWPHATVTEVDDWADLCEQAEGGGKETTVLMSLRIPGLQGWSQLADWRTFNRNIRMVLVLQNISQQLTTNALNLRPAGIISEDFTMRDLMSTLSLVTRGFYVFHAESNPPPISVSWIYEKEVPIGANMPSSEELKVLELISSGYTEKEVASAVHIEPRTVEAHLRRIRAKIGAKNSRHAVSLAVAWGLVTPSTEVGVH